MAKKVKIKLLRDVYVGGEVKKTDDVIELPKVQANMVVYSGKAEHYIENDTPDPQESIAGEELIDLMGMKKDELIKLAEEEKLDLPDKVKVSELRDLLEKHFSDDEHQGE